MDALPDHDHEHDHDDDSGDAVVAKAVAMCVLFLFSMVLGTIPIKLYTWLKWKRDAKNNIVVKLLLCLGAGVLLCTTFLHLLPEVAESIEDREEFPDIGVSFAQLLMCTGFFIMYFVEECVHFYLHRKENRGLELLRRSLSIRRGELDEKHLEETLESYHHNHHNHSHVDHSHVIVDSTTVVTIRGLLVVLALSIHELFEGLAVGLESSASTVWYMFGAVSAHKLVIAFCIGVELVTSGMRTLLVVIYVFTFAVVSPMGIGIGIAISEGDYSSATAISSVILQGLASGTLLYVVFFELLSGDRKGGLRQFLAVLLGFLVMTGITFIEGVLLKMPGYDDNTVSAKSVAMCVLFTASMGLGMVPVWLSRVFKWNSDTKNHQYVQILLCLSGGVLLCTTFLHLLPEVTEKIDDLEYISKYELHYAELLMCAGFFVMYLVEECVHAYMHHRQKTKSAISKTLSIRRGDSLTPEGSSTNIQQPISVCADDTHLHQGHSHLMAEDEDAAIQTLRGLLVVLALSIHELFEGLAVGLETSSKNVWYMFGAVSAHKLIIAFCIGVELVTSKMTTCLVVIYIFTFSVVTPLGIAIGILLTRNGEAPKNLFPIILQGLSSGTLLYVVFFEILSTERKSGLKQFSAVLAGFMLMFCLAFLE